MDAPVRYRFGAFVLSPRGRTLSRDGRVVALIPRYFDVLHLLVVRRDEAVSKADIFAAVWSDVIVSDGALAQAVRTLRRALDDDPREPRFIRTVSRHGYQFVAAVAVEPHDDEPSPANGAAAGAAAPGDDLAAAVDRLLAAAAADDAGDAREAAGRLHALGTDAAVAALTARAGHARALAFLRDARWDDPRAGGVPLAGDPEVARTAFEVVRLRLTDGAPLVAARARAGARLGIAVGGLAGLVGGAALALAPGSTASPFTAMALAVIGAGAGFLGVAAIVTGAAAAELVVRSRRAAAVAVAATLAAVLAGAAAHLAVRAILEGLFALDGLSVPGPLEALVLGAAVAGSYVLATWRVEGGGLPTPAGRRRARVVLATTAAGAVAGAVVGLAGRPLVGGLIHEIARASGDAPLALAPLARLIGEPAFGPLTQLMLAAFEGAMFGLAAGLGLTRRGAR
ncbi:MAG: transcriptional regulator [Vicinamibacterales bacterium]